MDDYRQAEGSLSVRNDVPLFKRWFGPLHPGGFRSSLLTLCSSMIGVGFLTLPVIGKKSGLYAMLFFIVLASLVSVFANWQLGRGFRATEGKTYSKIVARVDGRTSSLVTMIFLFMYVYVSAGAYYVFGSISVTPGAKFAMSFIDNWNIRPDFLKDDNKFANYFIIGLFFVCFLGSLPSKITALRYFTFVTAIINLVLGGVNLRLTIGAIYSALQLEGLLYEQRRCSKSNISNLQPRQEHFLKLLSLPIFLRKPVLGGECTERVSESFTETSRQGIDYLT